MDRIGRIWADGNLLRGASGDLKVEGAMRAYLGTGDKLVNPLIEADKGQQAPALRDCAYVVFEDLQLRDFGNRIPGLTFEIFAPEDDAVSLGQLVPQSDAATNQVQLRNARGFADEGGPIGPTLSAIDRVFPLSCFTTAIGLSLKSATGLPTDIPTLPEQLSDRDSEEAEDQLMRRAGSAGSEPLALRCYDEERDYQPGVQRALGVRTAGRETIVDLPVTMTAEGARTLANFNAHRSRWRDQTAVWRIGELDSKITPGSVVRMPGTSGYWLVRSWEWFDRGIELTLDRLAPELGPVAQSDAGASNIPVDVLASPTLLRVFETPPDDSSDPNSPIVLAAGSATNAGWRGAALYQEQGGTLDSVGSLNGSRSIIGELAEPLGPSACHVLEPKAQLVVDLPADDLSFTDTDVTGLALGANRTLVGAEVIQFCNAETISPTRWRLSGLLRGRAGTEDAAFVGHSTGTPFALLNDLPQALDTSLVAATDSTRIAAIGRGDDEAVFADLQNVGLSRRPPMPVWPRAATQTDGTRHFCWTRRGRGQWRWPESSEVPLVEENESYLVGYGPCNAPFASWSVSEPEFTLDPAQAANLISDFGPDSLWVRQVGTFAQSSALLLASIS